MRNETWGAVLVSRATESSALAAPLARQRADYAWRVTVVDTATAHYAASAWQALTDDAGASDPPAGLPRGCVSLRISAGDAPAQRFARELADSLWDAGLWVRIVPAGDAASATGVRFAFREDATLAGMIAEFLPVLQSSDTVFSPELDAAPGEIVVRLIGGPTEPEP